MQSMQNMVNMQNIQKCAKYTKCAKCKNVQSMQNMQETQNMPMKSKVQCPHSISRTGLARELGLVLLNRMPYSMGHFRINYCSYKYIRLLDEIIELLD